MNNDNKFCLERFKRVISENDGTMCYVLNNFENDIYAQDAIIDGENITLTDAKIVSDDELAIFKDKISFHISKINSFTKCPKNLYDDIEVADNSDNYYEFL